MKNPDASLAAHVEAVNRANHYGRQIYRRPAEALEPFVGCKVEKKGGGLMKHVEAALPELPHDNALSVFRDASLYSLAWTVKTCVPDDCGSCQYYRVGVYLADIRDGVLQKFYEPFDGRCDYTVEEVKAKREAYKAAKKACDDAQSALHPFGERD